MVGTAAGWDPPRAIGSGFGWDLRTQAIRLGSSHVLATAQVPGELVGATWDVAAIAGNQESVHPDNDLIVSSGQDSLVLEDVEGEAFLERTSAGSMTLRSQITVTLMMGQDEVFSGGITVEVRCPDPQVTTTTTASTTTTVAETTSTTSGPSSTPPGTLPFMGPGPAGAWVGLVSLVLGVGLVAIGRPPRVLSRSVDRRVAVRLIRPGALRSRPCTGLSSRGLLPGARPGHVA